MGMELELATLTDIIKELERQKVRFLFLGVECSIEIAIALDPAAKFKFRSRILL
ncbi:hypothetical protein [Adhaeretor mobilis]|uniref:Uncharacterized protein n=1 Tax=Adhaeretor mobilis TaxID=1930276 RepID=A0A517MPT8_9BACT|nr:hypothetical protein [Adhaeretor mobilis]QDS96898.1 hypothetical protein HG15A2_01570 [Adhaeretor mobilis]